MEGKTRIVNKDMLKPRHKSEHNRYEYYKYQASARGEGYQCTVSIYEIPPKKANYPYHYHTGNEEVFYIISGNGVLETPEGQSLVSAGDVIIFPANKNGAHRLTNVSATDMLVYLDCDTANDPDVVFYPKTGKVGILTENSAKFYRVNDDIDYFEGE